VSEAKPTLHVHCNSAGTWELCAGLGDYPPTVASVWYGEETARKMARAYESHDALVAALKSLADYVEVALGESPSTVKARAALAAARKEDA
jgi:hypothetical protein